MKRSTLRPTMKIIATFAVVLFVSGCVDGPVTPPLNAANALNLPAVSAKSAAFDAMRAAEGDDEAEIWTDPNGCHHYLATRAGEQWIQPLLSEDGILICG
jgi:hypothetical protein